MNDLQNLPELAPQGSPTASPRLRPVHGQDGSEHDAGAFVRPAQASTGGDDSGSPGVAVEVRAWGEGTGPLLYTATLTAKNGRSVNGMGYTPEAAEEDALKAWMRGEG